MLHTVCNFGRWHGCIHDCIHDEKLGNTPASCSVLGGSCWLCFLLGNPSMKIAGTGLAQCIELCAQQQQPCGSCGCFSLCKPAKFAAQLSLRWRCLAPGTLQMMRDAVQLQPCARCHFCLSVNRYILQILRRNIKNMY